MNLWRRLSGLKARLLHMRDPYMIIDLLAIAPFYLAFVVPSDLRVLRVFRLLRFLKLARYSPALSSLAGTLRAEWRALTGALIVMLGVLLLVSSLMYFLERTPSQRSLALCPMLCGGAWPR